MPRLTVCATAVPSITRDELRNSVFHQTGQKECSAERNLRAMNKLCPCIGLEEKLVEFHNCSWERSSMGYRPLRQSRLDWGQLHHMMDMHCPDGELGGVTLLDFFDFIANCVNTSHKKLQLSTLHRMWC